MVDNLSGVKRPLDKISRTEKRLYDYALNHPELCPPVGSEFIIRNLYGVKARIIVKMVLNGLPGTTRELLPLNEQPEHLRDKTFLEQHSKGMSRPGWVEWSDVYALELHKAVK